MARYFCEKAKTSVFDPRQRRNLGPGRAPTRVLTAVRVHLVRSDGWYLLDLRPALVGRNYSLGVAFPMDEIGWVPFRVGHLSYAIATVRWTVSVDGSAHGRSLPASYLSFAVNPLLFWGIAIYWFSVPSLRRARHLGVEISGKGSPEGSNPWTWTCGT